MRKDQGVARTAAGLGLGLAVLLGGPASADEHEPLTRQHRQGSDGIEDARGRATLTLEHVLVESRCLADHRAAQRGERAIDEEALAPHDQGHGRYASRLDVRHQLARVHAAA